MKDTPRMAATADEEAQLHDIKCLRNPDPQHQSTERRHRYSKVIALLGLTLLILWLYHTEWQEPRMLLKDIDVRDPRKRRLDTGANALDGQFDLLDLLSIRSTSGSINVGINPQSADEESPVPAELLVSSLSGQVTVDFPAFNAPERDYRVSIDTKSGSIDGNILHGSMTSITSNSASIEVQITPDTADHASNLRTSNRAGAQHVSLLSPAKEPGVSIKRMSSQHSTYSGSLVLRYPKEWEGTIEGHTRSGSLELHGGDLDIIHRDSTNNMGHHVLARKGNGNSTLNFQTWSGSVDIYFD